MVIMSPPPSIGFGPPAVAGGNPNTPTELSRLDWTGLGKKPVMKEPCMYIQQCGAGGVKTPLPAVSKPLVSIALRPPYALPGGNRNDANCAATCSIWGDTNLILCVTHSLYAVGP